MHELYLWPFREAVEAGVGSIMCSYNKVNGTYACENDQLLNGLLKGELGFRGFVQSDWSATMSTLPSVKGGLVSAHNVQYDDNLATSSNRMFTVSLSYRI
jgi:beta-glucosidase